MKQLELLEQRKFDDEDIQEDIEFLKEKMESSVQDLSSYDEYVTEVSGGGVGFDFQKFSIIFAPGVSIILFYI